VLQCVTVCYSVLQCVAVCCRVLQCVAVCCSGTQSWIHGRMLHTHYNKYNANRFLFDHLCCSVLQRVAACCGALKGRAEYLSVTQSSVHVHRLHTHCNEYMHTSWTHICTTNMSSVYPKWFDRLWHCDTLHILQHTITHRNTLQHAETHCNMLQYTVTHCNILQHTAAFCNTHTHTATHYSTLQHTTTHHITLQHTAPYCNMLQHTIIWRTGIPLLRRLLAIRCELLSRTSPVINSSPTTCRSALQYVAVHCSVLQRVQCVTVWGCARHNLTGTYLCSWLIPNLWRHHVVVFMCVTHVNENT